MKFPSLFFEIWCLQGFWVIACCDLDLLTPKSNQHIYEPNYISVIHTIDKKQMMIVVKYTGQRSMHETTAQDVEPPCFDSVVADEKNQGKIIASRLAYVTLPKTSLT